MRIIIYSLAVLLLCKIAVADTHHAFQINLQNDGYFAKNNATSWSSARGATTSNLTVSTADTLVVAVGWVDAATDTFKVWRTRLHTDTINGDNGGFASYFDSITVAAGHNARLDSLELAFTIKNVTDSGGCSGFLYAYVFDTCHTTRNYSPITYTTISYFNDVFTPDATLNNPFLFDSVATDTNTMGIGDEQRITFTLTDRTILDEIECMLSMTYTTSQPQALRFDVVACYDQTNTSPVSGNPYKFKAALCALEHTTAANRPTLTGYWTDVAPGSISFDQKPFDQLPHYNLPFNQSPYGK